MVAAYKQTHSPSWLAWFAFFAFFAFRELSRVNSHIGCVMLIMAALWSRAGHYIFILWFLSSTFFFYLFFLA